MNNIINATKLFSNNVYYFELLRKRILLESGKGAGKMVLSKYPRDEEAKGMIVEIGRRMYD